MNPKSELLSEAGEVWIQSSRRDAEGGEVLFSVFFGVLRLDSALVFYGVDDH